MDDERSGPGGVRRVALAFNDAITRQDLTSLSRLMTDDHAFIDADGNVFRGRARVLDAWSGFFDAFPDYRNVVGDGGRFVHPKGAGHDIFTSDPQVVQKTINDVLNDTH